MSNRLTLPTLGEPSSVTLDALYYPRAEKMEDFNFRAAPPPRSDGPVNHPNGRRSKAQSATSTTLSKRRSATASFATRQASPPPPASSSAIAASSRGWPPKTSDPAYHAPLFHPSQIGDLETEGALCDPATESTCPDRKERASFLAARTWDGKNSTGPAPSGTPSCAPLPPQRIAFPERTGSKLYRHQLKPPPIRASSTRSVSASSYLLFGPPSSAFPPAASQPSLTAPGPEEAPAEADMLPPDTSSSATVSNRILAAIKKPPRPLYNNSVDKTRSKHGTRGRQTATLPADVKATTPFSESAADAISTTLPSVEPCPPLLPFKSTPPVGALALIEAPQPLLPSRAGKSKLPVSARTPSAAPFPANGAQPERAPAFPPPPKGVRSRTVGKGTSDRPTALLAVSRSSLTPRQRKALERLLAFQATFEAAGKSKARLSHKISHPPPVAEPDSSTVALRDQPGHPPPPKARWSSSASSIVSSSLPQPAAPERARRPLAGRSPVASATHTRVEKQTATASRAPVPPKGYRGLQPFAPSPPSMPPPLGRRSTGGRARPRQHCPVQAAMTPFLGAAPPPPPLSAVSPELVPTAASEPARAIYARPPAADIPSEWQAEPPKVHREPPPVVRWPLSKRKAGEAATPAVVASLATGTPPAPAPLDSLATPTEVAARSTTLQRSSATVPTVSYSPPASTVTRAVVAKPRRATAKPPKGCRKPTPVDRGLSSEVEPATLTAAALPAADASLSADTPLAPASPSSAAEPPVAAVSSTTFQPPSLTVSAAATPASTVAQPVAATPRPAATPLAETPARRLDPVDLFDDEDPDDWKHLSRTQRQLLQSEGLLPYSKDDHLH